MVVATGWSSRVWLLANLLCTPAATYTTYHSPLLPDQRCRRWRSQMLLSIEVSADRCAFQVPMGILELKIVNST